MGNRRAPSLSKERIRNLKQYKKMPDDEFEAVWENKVAGIVTSSAFESRIVRKIDEFKKDYDVDDLKANDLLTLRALAQAYITLEDLEQVYYEMRIDGIDLDSDKVFKFEKISNVMSSIRNDISKMQIDLGITRKSRKGDKEQSVINELETLKDKAKLFYEKKMFYMFCPKCNMLLATTWFLYPEEKNNKIQLICNRKLQSGEICGHKLQITSKELLDKKGVNTEDVPEFFK